MSKCLFPTLLVVAVSVHFLAYGSRLSDDDGKDAKIEAHEDASGDSRSESAGRADDYDYQDHSVSTARQDHAGNQGQRTHSHGPSSDIDSALQRNHTSDEGETHEDDARRLQDEASCAHKREETASHALAVARKDEKDCQEKVRNAERAMDLAQKKANEADEKVLKTLAHRMADRIQTFENRKSEEKLDIQDRDVRLGFAGGPHLDDHEVMAAGLSHELKNDPSLELLLQETHSVGSAGQAFDCRAGLSTWQTGWSDLKKSWCCTNARLGCPDGVGTASAADNYDYNDA